MARTHSLDHYRLLGRSGLRVSPIALGAMTFGTDWGWGADRDEVARILDTYLDRGGNSIDTADVYTGGTSERLLGELLGERRERVVLASKYTSSTSPGDPLASGNSRRNMVRSVEASLRRLRTDYLDLLYLHAWDGTTPVEEILRGMDDLVRAGKVVYVGLSDVPAWQASRMQAIADLRGWSPVVALQIEYSLLQRTVERELIPMAAETGMGVIPWSPLGSGVLTGKYSRDDLAAQRPADGVTGTRRDVAVGNGALTAHGLDVAEVVGEVAGELGVSAAQVAIAWTLENPAVTSPIVGARTAAQLEDDLGALEVELSDDQRARLDRASAVELGFPHDFLALPMTREVVTGGVTVEAR